MQCLGKTAKQNDYRERALKVVNIAGMAGSIYSYVVTIAGMSHHVINTRVVNIIGMILKNQSGWP